MNALQIVFAIGCALVLSCQAAYIYLAHRGRSAVLHSSSDTRYNMTWRRGLFPGLAAVGMLTSIYADADVMLWWLPSSWGAHDEYGEFTAYRASLAGLFTFMAGGALVIFIDRAVHNESYLLWASTERKELAKILKSYDSADSLRVLLGEYEKIIASLRSGLPRHNDMEQLELRSSFIEEELVFIYDRLVEIVHTRIAELVPTRNADA